MLTGLEELEAKRAKLAAAERAQLAELEGGAIETAEAARTAARNLRGKKEISGAITRLRNNLRYQATHQGKLRSTNLFMSEVPSQALATKLAEHLAAVLDGQRPARAMQQGLDQLGAAFTRVMGRLHVVLLDETNK